VRRVGVHTLSLPVRAVGYRSFALTKRKRCFRDIALFSLSLSLTV